MYLVLSGPFPYFDDNQAKSRLMKQFLLFLFMFLATMHFALAQQGEDCADCPEENIAEQIKIFPNPASDYIKMDAPEEAQQLYVFNVFIVNLNCCHYRKGTTSVIDVKIIVVSSTPVTLLQGLSVARSYLTFRYFTPAS